MAKTCGERRVGQRLGRSDHAPSASQGKEREGPNIKPKGTHWWRKSKEKQKEKGGGGGGGTGSSPQDLVAVQNGMLNPSWNRCCLLVWLLHHSLPKQETTMTLVARG